MPGERDRSTARREGSAETAPAGYAHALKCQTRGQADGCAQVSCASLVCALRFRSPRLQNPPTRPNSESAHPAPR